MGLLSSGNATISHLHSEVTGPDLNANYICQAHLNGTCSANCLCLMDPYRLQVGFPQRNFEQLARALYGSQQIVWIRHARRTRWAKEGQLLGFARATSDHVVAATIWDVAVSCQTDKSLRFHAKSAYVLASLGLCTEKPPGTIRILWF